MSIGAEALAAFLARQLARGEQCTLIPSGVAPEAVDVVATALTLGRHFELADDPHVLLARFGPTIDRFADRTSVIARALTDAGAFEELLAVMVDDIPWGPEDELERLAPLDGRSYTDSDGQQRSLSMAELRAALAATPHRVRSTAVGQHVEWLIRRICQEKPREEV